MSELSKITVLIASRGRLEELSRAVGTLYAVQRPDAAVELVMVSSGSDETAAAMTTLASMAPPWIATQVVHEERVGKCRALNRGLSVCSGDVIAFTDDDVLIEPSYLVQLEAGFQQTRADALQGRVCLRLLGNRPDWFTHHCEALMAATCYLDRQAPAKLANLNSCNMAVRRDAVLATGPFSELLGPGVRRFPLGDDSEWSMRLVRSGYRACYWPGMSVEHQISVERASLAYLMERSYLSGIFVAAECAAEPIRTSLRSLYRLAVDGAQAVRLWLQGRPGPAADRVMQVARHCGVLCGLMGRARGHPAARLAA